MIEIICGEKGKGKTKELLEKVNEMMRQMSLPNIIPGQLTNLQKK